MKNYLQNFLNGTEKWREERIKKVSGISAQTLRHAIIEFTINLIFIRTTIWMNYYNNIVRVKDYLWVEPANDEDATPTKGKSTKSSKTIKEKLCVNCARPTSNGSSCDVNSVNAGSV